MYAVCHEVFGLPLATVEEGVHGEEEGLDSDSDSDYISSSHIRLIRCLAVIRQASCTRKHLV